MTNQAQAVIDRFRGCLLGMAAGDAVGTTLEFTMPGSFKPIEDMVGGGPFGLKPGEWTDDTSMALCLAESLIERLDFDPVDQLARYVKWYRNGHLSHNGRCFDIGNTVRSALLKFEQQEIPNCGSTDPSSAGNGSIMRLAPVPMFYAFQSALAIERSGESSRTTHGATTCVDACRYMGALIVGALNGVGKEELLSERYSPIPGYWQEHPLTPEIDEIASGSFKRREPPDIKGTGYVVKSLEAALWAFHKTDSFRDGCLLAVNLGHDADTTGAVFGQIAGAYYGVSGIPPSWVDQLAMGENIRTFADKLYEISRNSQERPEMNDNYTHISVVLDRSGSMESIRDDVIGGFNSFLQEQKKQKGVATLTLVQFDSRDPYEIVSHFKPIQDISELDRTTYVPRASTPLFDAWGRAINDLEQSLNKMKREARPSRVIVAVITDGGENCSTEFKRQQIAKLIKDRTEKDDWQFVYLSTDLSAVSDAIAYGIQTDRTLLFNRTGQGTRAAWDAFARESSDYRSGRKQRMGFLPEDRMRPDDPVGKDIVAQSAEIGSLDNPIIASTTQDLKDGLDQAMGASAKTIVIRNRRAKTSHKAVAGIRSLSFDKLTKLKQAVASGGQETITQITGTLDPKRKRAIERLGYARSLRLAENHRELTYVRSDNRDERLCVLEREADSTATPKADDHTSEKSPNRVAFEELIADGAIDVNRGPIFDWTPTPIAHEIDFDKVEGMMLGLAIGDGLGNGSEGFNPEDRRDRFDEISDYLPQRYAGFRRVGLPTDDTQLAFWTLEQMLADDGFVPANVAKLYASGRRIFGLGRTVRSFIRNFKDGGKPWYQSGPKSAGNGALMRIAPMLIPFLKKPGSDLWVDTALSAMITHNDSGSIAACTTFTHMLWKLLAMKKAPEPLWWPSEFVRLASMLECDHSYRPRGGHFTGFQGSIAKFVQDHVVGAYQKGLSTLDACQSWQSGAFLLETVPCAIYILMKHGQDLEEAIVRAVNDTRDNDTVAAIVGAAVGALHGKRAIPDRWVTNLLGRTMQDDDGRVFQLLEEARLRWWEPKSDSSGANDTISPKDGTASAIDRDKDEGNISGDEEPSCESNSATIWFSKDGTMWVKKRLFPPLGTFWVVPEEFQHFGPITYQRVEQRTRKFTFEAFTADEIEVRGFENPKEDGLILSAPLLHYGTPDGLSYKVGSYALELWFAWHSQPDEVKAEYACCVRLLGKRAPHLSPTRADSKPFARSYAVVPGQLWGGCYPGDKKPDVAKKKLNGLLDCGVGLVVSLMEQDERGHGGEAFAPYELVLGELAKRRGREVRTVRYAIRDNTVPSVQEMKQILDAIDNSIEQGIPVFVHCWGGKGRTGTVVGCYLARHGIATGEDAVRRVAALRHDSQDPTAYARSPSTYEQIAMVKTWPQESVRETKAGN